MSRARENADGARLDAPLASPDFTGTVDLTGTTVSLDDDEISGDKIHGGTISGSPTLVTPALGTVATGNLSNTAIVYPVGHILGVAMLADVYDGGGGSTSTSNTLRRLNTIAYEIGMSVTLGSNEWTFDEAGSYLINAHGPATESYRHILRLYSDTGSALVATGSAEFTEVGHGQYTQSFVYGKVVISDAQKTGGGSEKSYGLYHIVDSTWATTGLGQYNSDTTVEQHLQIQIFKIQE